MTHPDVYDAGEDHMKAAMQRLSVQKPQEAQVYATLALVAETTRLVEMIDQLRAELVDGQESMTLQLHAITDSLNAVIASDEMPSTFGT